MIPKTISRYVVEGDKANAEGGRDDKRPKGGEGGGDQQTNMIIQRSLMTAVQTFFYTTRGKGKRTTTKTLYKKNMNFELTGWYCPK